MGPGPADANSNAAEGLRGDQLDAAVGLGPGTQPLCASVSLLGGDPGGYEGPEAVWTRSEPRAEALGSAFPLLRESPVRLAALFLGNSSATGSNKAFGAAGQRAGVRKGQRGSPGPREPVTWGPRSPLLGLCGPGVFLARGGRPRSWGGSRRRVPRRSASLFPCPPSHHLSWAPLTLRDCSPRRVR